MGRVANKTETPAIDTEALVRVFVTLESFDSTEENPTILPDMSRELGEDDTTVYAWLNALEDAELASSTGRFTNSVWWIAVPDVSADNAENIAREALDNFTPETEPAKPARKVSQAKPKAPAKAPEAPAPVEAPKVAEDAPKPRMMPKSMGMAKGAPADLSTRELVLSEPVVSKGEPFNFDKIIAAIHEGLKTASNDPTDYVFPEEVTNLPARPEGVNENVWHMVFNAHSVNEFSTLRARLFWTERAKTQAAA